MLTSDLYASLHFVFRLHKQVQHLVRMDDRLTVVGHQTNERRVPLWEGQNYERFIYMQRWGQR